MSFLEKLQEIRNFAGDAQTVGLPDSDISLHCQNNPLLVQVIHEAYDMHLCLRAEDAPLLKKNERELLEIIQEDFVNFYAADTVNPYVSLAARGPWVVTLHGAILHDSGGYGMLGFGHGPEEILTVMAKNHVMANVMTANLEQKKLMDLLREEIGHSRDSRNGLFDKFLCLNSGSESVSMAARISDIQAKLKTDPGCPYEGRSIKMLSLKGSFHGRTDRPSQASDSTQKASLSLASFRDRRNLWTVEPNNCEALRATFDKAAKENVFIEMMFIEPVMGEGDPGKAISPKFYALARELTANHGSLLLVDSIQAGLRTHGVLSITDYPGFRELPAPDMETFSKALNAGQFPLSVLAMTTDTAKLYRIGIYGNTMTGNPRATAVACSVLKQLKPELRENIVARGKEFLEKFSQVQKQFPEIVTNIQGTGLLFAISLNKQGYAVVGSQGVEQHLRHHGIGVIHGGANALRFTPHFRITSTEVDLVVAKLMEALTRGPIYGHLQD